MKNSLFIINIIVVLVIASAAFFGKHQFESLRQNYVELNTSTLSLVAEEQAAKLLAETVEARTKLTNATVNTKNLPDFISELESLADQTGAEIDLASVNEPSDTNPNIKLDFQLVGSYQSLFHFTRLLDALPFQIKVDQIEFNRQSTAVDKKSSPIWRAHFLIELLNLPTQK